MNKKEILLIVLAIINIALIEICRTEFHLASFLNGAVSIAMYNIIFND